MKNVGDLYLHLYPGSEIYLSLLSEQKSSTKYSIDLLWAIAIFLENT